MAREVWNASDKLYTMRNASVYTREMWNASGKWKARAMRNASDTCVGPQGRLDQRRNEVHPSASILQPGDMSNDSCPLLAKPL
jgi:hypothetical protein